MLKKLIIALLIVSMAMFCFVSCDDDDSSSETETTYAVGDKGPAGGIVFYDCDADNNSGNSDGLVSSTAGWRYLEAAPADLRVVNGNPTVDSSVEGYSNASTGYVFGYYRETANGSNLYVNGETTYNSDNCTGTAIGTGKTNTELLVGAMKTAAYTEFIGDNTTANYAAKLCSDLSYGGQNDWFLPSKDELAQMYAQKSTIGGFGYDYYWSSSEGSSYADDAWLQYFSSGYQGNYYRYYEGRVRPLRAF